MKGVGFLFAALSRIHNLGLEYRDSGFNKRSIERYIYPTFCVLCKAQSYAERALCAAYFMISRGNKETISCLINALDFTIFATTEIDEQVPCCRLRNKWQHTTCRRERIYGCTGLDVIAFSRALRWNHKKRQIS